MKPIQAHPSETEVDKGNPNEGNTVKEIHIRVSAHKQDALNGKNNSNNQINEIYNAYPKHVGKPAATKAIRRALEKFPFSFLLERTQLYAQVCNAPDQYIPYPSNWFKDERFNDDPTTWRRPTGAKGKPVPVIIRSDKFGDGISTL